MDIFTRMSLFSSRGTLVQAVSCLFFPLEEEKNSSDRHWDVEMRDRVKERELRCHRARLRG